MDNHGYLTNHQEWSEELALDIARLEGITLSSEHWLVIHFCRRFYREFNVSPSTRMMIKAIAKECGKEKGNSRYLFRLFPHTAKQIAKIAGLPKPVICL